MNPLLILSTLVALTVLPLFWRSLQLRMPAPARFVGQVAPPREPRSDADLGHLLDAMSTDCAAMLHRGGIVLQQHVACDTLPVFVQQQGIRQLLGHVVALACRAMQQGGTLKLLARADGEQAVVHFIDACPSGEASALGRLFERVASGRDPRESGQGSVDSIVADCQRIAGDHGGRIYPAPSPLGGELGLTLRLPLCALPGAAGR
jgi:signal transduction histidine kinase